MSFILVLIEQYLCHWISWFNASIHKTSGDESCIEMFLSFMYDVCGELEHYV